MRRMTPEEDFGAVRKVLNIKRYEVPPPGYFDSFSSKVISRIEAEAAYRQMPWWKRLTAHLLTEPMTTGAYAVVALILGVLTTALTQSSEADLLGHLEMEGTAPVVQATIGGTTQEPAVFEAIPLRAAFFQPQPEGRSSSSLTPVIQLPQQQAAVRPVVYTSF